LINLNRNLTTVLSILALSGCGYISVPTGTSEDRYLDSGSKMVVATNLKSIRYDADNKSLVLEVEQYRLGQLHSVPKYLEHSSMGTRFFLSHAEAKPLDSFDWSPMKTTYSSIREVVNEVSISSNKGLLVNVPIRDVGSKVELDVDQLIQKLRPNTEYTLSCARCLPDLSGLTKYSGSIPAYPALNTTISFKIEPQQYAEIKKRIDIQLLAEAQKKRERELAERKREQELAQQEQERKAQARKAEADRKREAARIAREGDGSPDDLLCKKYGFKPNTQDYAGCRMQVDVAKREMQQQQAIYQAQLQQAQQAQEAERKRRQSDFMLGMGLRMMGGQSAAGAAVDQSVGAPMYQPPPPSARTYTFPNGRMMTCTTNGNVTNCY
jgi:hypothetical protein